MARKRWPSRTGDHRRNLPAPQLQNRPGGKYLFQSNFFQVSPLFKNFFRRIKLALQATDRQWRFAHHGLIGFQPETSRDRHQWKRNGMKTFPQ